MNTEALEIRVLLADVLYDRVDDTVKRGVADRRVGVISAGMQVPADAEHGAERRQNVERLIA